MLAPLRSLECLQDTEANTNIRLYLQLCLPLFIYGTSNLHLPVVAPHAQQSACASRTTHIHQTSHCILANTFLSPPTHAWSMTGLCCSSPVLPVEHCGKLTRCCNLFLLRYLQRMAWTSPCMWTSWAQCLSSSCVSVCRAHRESESAVLLQLQ